MSKPDQKLINNILDSNMLPVITNNVFNALSEYDRNELLDDFVLNSKFVYPQGNPIANSLYSPIDLWNYEVNSDFDDEDGNRREFPFTNFETTSTDLNEIKSEFLEEHTASNEFYRWADDMFGQDWSNNESELTDEYKQTIELLFVSSLVADTDKLVTFLNDNLNALDETKTNSLLRVTGDHLHLSNGIDDENTDDNVSDPYGDKMDYLTKMSSKP